MSLPSSTTILIVGAGPVGLAAALSLLHHGFHDFVIVDAIPQGHNTSRAAVIHPATLEENCLDDLVSKGVKWTRFNIGTRSTKLISPNYESLKSYTRHPYMLFITQNVVEHTLEEKLTSLGVSVHRPFRVVGLKSNVENPLLSDVTFEDGRVITAKYVIGADGARSTVRSMGGIGFSDPTFTKEEANNNVAQMIVADVTFETSNPNEFMAGGALSPQGLFLFFPLPSSFNEVIADGRNPIPDRVYRFGCGVPLEDGEIPHSASKEYLQSLIDRFASYDLVSDPSLNPNPIRIKEVLWTSRFRTRASVSDTAFTRLAVGDGQDGGAILLIGDAAHIHSPVGGQGMNLGLRDAISVGQVLTRHIDASKTKPLSEADVLLRDFAATRHARALEVIKLTKNFLSVTGMKYRERFSWWCPIDSATVRAWGLWILGRFPFVPNRMAWELSGLSRR